LGLVEHLIRKVVVPAAGLGTRLFPATKEQPKEMLPIFSRSSNGDVCVKPLLQLVFEQLYNVGFREFCFVVGRGKRSIEDHFTPDFNSVVMLKNSGKGVRASDLDGFYEGIEVEGATNIVRGHLVETTKAGHGLIYETFSCTAEGETWKGVYGAWYCDKSQRLYQLAVLYVEQTPLEEFQRYLDSFVCH